MMIFIIVYILQFCIYDSWLTVKISNTIFVEKHIKSKISQSNLNIAREMLILNNDFLTLRFRIQMHGKKFM